MTRLPFLRAIALVVMLLAAGCASFQQASDTVRVRQPGNRTYDAPVNVAESAKALSQYAVLSENAYFGSWKKQRDVETPQEARTYEPPPATQETYDRLCAPGETGPLPLSGWRMWDNFPSPGLIGEALRVGLYVEVWEKVGATPPVIAVVFRGTEFTSLKDWISNLRWFLRFVPWYEDQYSVVSRRVGKEVVNRLASGNTDPFQLVAVGHSLGGGLAQHLAYSLPPGPEDRRVPRVSSVYAFDPSPVTGWFSVERALRETNAAELRIDRVFEHGEILAYARLLLSYVNPPSAAHPSVREIRYNFVQSLNPFSSHSMRLLACALVHASGQAAIPDLLERFRKK